MRRTLDTSAGNAGGSAGRGNRRARTDEGLPGAVSQYLEYLLYERGRSKNTIDAYRRDLDQFCAFLAERFNIKDPDGIRVSQVVAFLRETLSTFSTRSQSRKLVVIRNFLKFCHFEEIMTDDIGGLIQSARPWLKIPKSLSVGQTDKLLQAAGNKTRAEWGAVEAAARKAAQQVDALSKTKDDSSRTNDAIDTALSVRNAALILFIYATGARVSEACDLKTEWVYVNEGVVRIEGKGNKQRVVPLGRSASAALSAYLTTARPLFDLRNAPFVFLSRNGWRLSRQEVYRLVKRYSTAAGLTVKVSPHTLRHSCATHLLEGGANLRAVQEILGHADITTTEIYTHVNARRLVDTHSKFHPRCG